MEDSHRAIMLPVCRYLRKAMKKYHKCDLVMKGLSSAEHLERIKKVSQRMVDTILRRYQLACTAKTHVITHTPSSDEENDMLVKGPHEIARNEHREQANNDKNLFMLDEELERVINRTAARSRNKEAVTNVKRHKNS